MVPVFYILLYFDTKWQNSCTILVQELYFLFYIILFYCKWANRLKQFNYPQILIF